MADGVVGSLLERKERPAYVKFETVAVENAAASLAAGHYVGRDVDYALITPPYSKDVFKVKVEQWKLNMKQDVQNGRMPQEWMDQYLDNYKRWKAGQELPLNGTPIKGWGVISPAQQETLLRMNILTVEDLGGINDEGISRIGMGGHDLKNKANAWLAQLRDKGPLTQEIAAMKAENALLKANVETLTGQVQQLMAQVGATQAQEAMLQRTPTMLAVEPAASITVADIFEEPEPANKRAAPLPLVAAQPVAKTEQL